uniref:Uncharacterized protein n=1 Tax=Oryza nivara TaxID=4536 RepID=A0A0E0H089_ORYNI
MARRPCRIRSLLRGSGARATPSRRRRARGRRGGQIRPPSIRIQSRRPSPEPQAARRRSAAVQSRRGRGCGAAVRRQRRHGLAVRRRWRSCAKAEAQALRWRRGNEPADTALAGRGASAGWPAGRRRRRRQRVHEVRLARAEASEARSVAAEATVVRGGAVEVPVRCDEAARRGGSGRCGGRRGQWPGEARPVAARRDWPAGGAGAVVPMLRRRFWMAVEQWYMCGRSTGGGRQVKTQSGLGRTGIDDIRASFPS